MGLPWATIRLRGSTAVGLERGDRDRGSACAKGAGVGTCPGLGTSAIVTTRNAAVRSAAGRRRGDRPNTARRPRSRHGTPRLNARAASAPNPRPRVVRVQRLRQRVVTQQKLFFPSALQSAGLPPTPRKFAPQPRTLLRPRLPAGTSQCPGPGTQVARSRHLGWAEEAGH